MRFGICLALAALLCAAPGYLQRAGRPRHADDLAAHALLLPAPWRTLALT